MRWKWSCTEGIRHGAEKTLMASRLLFGWTDLTCTYVTISGFATVWKMNGKATPFVKSSFFSSWLHLVLDFSRVPVVWVSHVLVPWGLVSNQGLLLVVVGDRPGGVLVGGTPVTPSVSTRPASVVGRGCGVLVLPGRVLLVSSFVTVVPALGHYQGEISSHWG